MFPDIRTHLYLNGYLNYYYPQLILPPSLCYSCHNAYYMFSTSFVSHFVFSFLPPHLIYVHPSLKLETIPCSVSLVFPGDEALSSSKMNAVTHSE